MSKHRTADFFVTAISEKLSCDDLTELIDQIPDEGWSKGDVYVRRGRSRVYRFSRWAAAEHASGSANDWEQAIDKLFKRLGRVQSHFQALPEEVVIKFGANITETNDVFGFGLSAQQIAFASSIRASLDVSIVVAMDRTPRPAP